MNKTYYWLIGSVSASAVVVGLIIAAFRYELLICTASVEKISEEVRKVQVERKKVTCSFITHGTIKHEVVDVLSFPIASKTVQHVSNAWLQVVYDEQLLHEPVAVTHVASAPLDGAYFISFDRYPFDKSCPIQAKIDLISGLLYSLGNAGITFKRIYFMVNGQTMEDAHLDFAHGWVRVDSLDTLIE